MSISCYPKPDIFTLPNPDIITLLLQQKGHGLQRATLLAMFRVLAKYGARYLDRPTPIFLIGELETFLHPYAQRLIAEAIQALIDRYQIVTSTHSPFIINPESIKGYRRVVKNTEQGSKNTAFSQIKSLDERQIKYHLERRGNLEGLFADRIILVEGDNDQGFFKKLMKIFNVRYPPRTFTLFVKAYGKQEVRKTKEFYILMGFPSVQVISDLDYIFANDFVNLLKELGMDETYSKKLRDHIEWVKDGDPSLEDILLIIKKKGEPKFLSALLEELKIHKIYILPKGAPEMYYKNNLGQKDAWDSLSSEADLLEPEYLKQLITTLMTP